MTCEYYRYATSRVSDGMQQNAQAMIISLYMYIGGTDSKLWYNHID